MDFSPDGRILASGDDYGRLQLWNMESRLPIGPPLVGHDADIFNLSFSPDGSKLASGDIGGNVVLWDIVLEHWVDIACQRANRNLTQQEWRRYFGDEPYRVTCPQLP
jgi:WD40 repeat protein